MLSLPQRVVALHAGFDAAAIPHAFGGALALAYWTLEPRGTRDIDVNLFVASSECRRALDALPDGVDAGPEVEATIVGDGQVRVFWDDTPLDLFFDYAPVHGAAARHRQTVPFAGGEIPILAAEELTVFKVMFDRTRDWADIEAMLEAGRVDVDAVRSLLATMLDAGDPRLARLDGLV